MRKDLRLLSFEGQVLYQSLPMPMEVLITDLRRGECPRIVPPRVYPRLRQVVRE
jgi:hypothetical protein